MPREPEDSIPKEPPARTAGEVSDSKGGVSPLSEQSNLSSVGLLLAKFCDRRLYLRYPLILVLSALLIGAALAHWLGGAASLVIVCAIALCLGIGLHRTAEPASARRAGTISVLAIAFMGLGVLHSVLSMPDHADDLSKLATRKEEPLVARAVISGAAIWSPNPNHRPQDPESAPHQTRWEVRVVSVRNQVDDWREVRVKSTLQVEGRIEDLFPGDEILLHGAMRKIYPPTNPGGYDREMSAAREGRFVVLKADDRSQIQVLQNGGQFPLLRLRAKAVAYVDRNLRRWVTHDQAPLAAALVFGQRQQVDWQDQQQLMATGTLHMLAISGMHVEMVALGIVLLCMLLRLRNWQRFTLLTVLCIAYAILAAGKPPVLRATILVVTFELARVQGRQARLGNLLALAGIILFWSAYSYLFNAGVHLSFLAVAAIGVFLFESKTNLDEESPLNELLRENWGLLMRWSHLAWRKVRASFQLSFWVWLITCPLIWWHFNLVSPIAIPLNVLLMIPLTLGLLAGLIAGLLGPIPWVGFLMGRVCGANLNLISGLVGYAESIQGGHFWLPSLPLGCIVLFYLVVASWLVCFGRERRKLLASILLMFLVAIVGWQAVGPRGFATRQQSGGGRASDSVASEVPASEKEAIQDRKGEFRLTFLDVGHGTSVILELPSGAIWGYDAGHMGASERSHEEIANALWSLGASRIEKLFISHADADHYNAVAGLAKRFRIDQVVSTSRFFNSDDKPVQELIRLLESKQVALVTYHAGESGSVAGMDWKVLHPAHGAWVENDNASSLTLLLEYESTRVLLPGDLESGGLSTLVELPPRPCHILMGPHHGSVTLDPSDLLDWCKPKFVVISGNHRANRQRVLSRYQEPNRHVAVTFRDGAIQCRIGIHGTSFWKWGRDSDELGQPTRWQPCEQKDVDSKADRLTYSP